MTNIGAPGSGLSRREFIAASGTSGGLAVAGCIDTARDGAAPASPDTTAARQQTIPTTGPPQVVTVDEQGDTVRVHWVNAGTRPN